MSKIEWNESLSVGIDLIDDQHKKWIEYYNNANEVIASMEGPEHISKTLGFLIDYTEEHFGTEEKQMEAHAYPAYEEHRAKHDELRKTLSNLVADYEEDGPTHELSSYVGNLLGNWLVQHIEEIDMQFGAFVKAEGITIE